MNKEQKLFEIASRQQGYFSSRQAESCGFSRTNFHRKINSGKWSREHLRGIYRISNFPNTERQDLALWSLWSEDRHGNPQGVWSHETALDVHGLSDVAPRKLHMSVPRGFRKKNSHTECLRFHHVDEIPRTDIEIREGYKVTTPFRTIADIICEGTTQFEHIEQAILDLAIQKSLIKGLVTFREMEGLQKISESKEVNEIISKAIDKVWTDANEELAKFGRLLEPYTIGLHIEGHGFGTAVLCQYKSQYFLITADHVGRAFRKSKSIHMILRFDKFRREYPVKSSKNFKVIEWDPTFDEQTLSNVLENHPRDLAIVIPSEEIINTLKIYKSFYVIPKDPQSFSLDDALISLGGIEPLKSEDGKTCQLHVGPYAFVASEYHQFRDSDYIICPVSNSTYEIRNLRRKALKSFQGLSGTGLWKIDKDEPILVGIAIAEDPIGYNPSSGSRDIYFHGTNSILSLLSIAGHSHEF